MFEIEARSTRCCIRFWEWVRLITLHVYGEWSATSHMLHTCFRIKRDQQHVAYLSQSEAASFKHSILHMCVREWSAISNTLHSIYKHEAQSPIFKIFVWQWSVIGQTLHTCLRINHEHSNFTDLFVNEGNQPNSAYVFWEWNGISQTLHCVSEWSAIAKLRIRRRERVDPAKRRIYVWELITIRKT